MTEAERQARIHHHMYETCEGIAEHAERIVTLEELAKRLYWCANGDFPCKGCFMWDGEHCHSKDLMQELGIGVDE